MLSIRFKYFFQKFHGSGWLATDPTPLASFPWRPSLQGPQSLHATGILNKKLVLFTAKCYSFVLPVEYLSSLFAVNSFSPVPWIIKECCTHHPAEAARSGHLIASQTLNQQINFLETMKEYRTNTSAKNMVSLESNSCIEKVLNKVSRFHPGFPQHSPHSMAQVEEQCQCEGRCVFHHSSCGGIEERDTSSQLNKGSCQRRGCACICNHHMHCITSEWQWQWWQCDSNRPLHLQKRPKNLRVTTKCDASFISAASSHTKQMFIGTNMNQNSNSTPQLVSFLSAWWMRFGKINRIGQQLYAE